MLDSERDRIFGEWLAGHKGILFKVVRAYAFEHADRQDLFQEVAIQVWRSVDAYRGESSVPTWIYRIALNAAISWTRKQDRHQRGKQPLEIVDGLLTASAAEADPRVEWLYRQIAQLKDMDRSVALLMLDGFAYKEIATIAGISEGNVAVKINRIKAALSRPAGKGSRIMNLDDVIAGLALEGRVAALWRGQDPASSVAAAGTGEAREAVAQERRVVYVMNAVLLITAALFFAILIDPNQPRRFLPTDRVGLRRWGRRRGRRPHPGGGAVCAPAGLGRRASRALATRFGITCAVVSRSSTPRRRVSAAWR